MRRLSQTIGIVRQTRWLFVCLVVLLARVSSVSANPVVTGTSPTLTATAQSQVLTVSGSEFATSASATVKNPSGQLVANTVAYVSTTTLRITAIFGISGSWSVRIKVKNKQSNTFVFTVVAASAPPLAVTCPANQSATSPDGNAVVVTYPPATATGGTSPYAISGSPASGSSFPVGSTVVMQTATDHSSPQQTAQCTFTVTVTTSPPATCTAGLTLTSDILLQGGDVLEWIGSPSAPCVVNGQGHRIMVDGGGSWSGHIAVDYAVITGLGTSTVFAIGDNSGLSYAYLNGAQISVRHTIFHQSGAFNFYSVNGASIVWSYNVYGADNLVLAGHDAAQAASWFTEQGTSTAPKYFQGNRVERASARFLSPNWLVGAPRGTPCNTGVENVFIGPRVGFELGGQGSYASCYYTHVNLDVLPAPPDSNDYWSQVGNIGPIGAGAEIGPGIARTGHWVASGIDGTLRDAILVEANGHDHIRLGNGGQVINPLIFATFPGCNRYSAPPYGLPDSVGLWQTGNALTVTNAIMDLRGPDGALTAFHQDPGTTLTHTGEAIIRLGSDTTRRGPLPWGTAQLGTSSPDNAGFPFNDDDLLNGTSTLQDWIDYLWWVYAPAGAGGTPPRLAQTNQRPAATVGPDLTLPAGVTDVQLCGYAADDRGPLSTRWTVVSGPNTPIFDDASRSITQAHGLVPGIYVLRFTASDGSLATSRDQTITVQGGTNVATQHPRLWLDAKTLARLKAAAAANDARWLSTKAHADALASWTVVPFDRYNCPNNTSICYGYQGDGWYDAFLTLGFAYQVTGQAGYCTNVKALITTINASTVAGDLTPISADSGYPSRAAALGLGLGHDWCYSQLDATTKAAAANTAKAWFDWYKANALSATGPASDNYFVGHLIGFGFLGMTLTGDDPRGAELASYMRGLFDTVVVPAFNGGLLTGGYPLAGYVYGTNSFVRLLQYGVGVRTATGEDIVASSHMGPAIVRNLIYNLKPNRWQFTDEADYPGECTGIMDYVLTLMLPTMTAGTPESGYAQWLHQHRAPNPGCYFSPDAFSSLLWYDASIPTADYRTTFPLSVYSAGDEHLIARSSWQDDAVWVSYRAFNAAPDGHQLRGAGHIGYQRGGDFFLVNSGQWKGSQGWGGSPETYDGTSARANTLNYQNPWDGNYAGGQGWWGTNHTLAHVDTPSYSYLIADLQSAYTYIPTGLQAFTRAVTALSDGSVVVCDHIVAANATDAKTLAWHFNPNAAFTLSNNVLTATLGASKFQVSVFSPMSVATVIGQDTVAQGDPTPTTKRLDVTVAGQTMNVVTVLTAVGAATTLPPVSYVGTATSMGAKVGARQVICALDASTVTAQ